MILALLLISPLSAQEAQVTEEPPSPHIERVILISLDGARPDAILQANTPNLHQLAAEGAVDWQAQTVDPSVTLPAHTSMLTGLSVEEHGVTFNSVLLDCSPIAPLTWLAVAADAGMSAAIVAGKEKFCIYDQRDTVDYTFAREGDRSVADRVIELLDADTKLIFAHFPNPDYFGHSTGWMSETYINELHSTDFQVERIIERLRALNLIDETLVIITADHGGHGNGHGSTLPEDMTIPWIAYGAGIKVGMELNGVVNTTDTAVTILWALGLPLPETDASRPIIEAFE